MPVGRGMAIGTRLLERVGAAMLVALLAVSVTNEWMAFQQLRTRIVGEHAADLTRDFVVAAARQLAVHALVFVGGMLLVAMAGRRLTMRAPPRRLFAVLLISCAPLVLYAVGLSVALTSGRTADVWVLQDDGTTSTQLTRTIVEAMPNLLDSPAWLRGVALAASALATIALQWRVCGVRVGAAIAIGIGACAVTFISGFAG